MDLHGRKLVDAAIMLIVGHLSLRHVVDKPAQPDDSDQIPAEPTPQQIKKTDPASDNINLQTSPYRTTQAHKQVLARRYIKTNASSLTMLTEQICQGDRSGMTDYESIVGPAPAE